MASERFWRELQEVFTSSGTDKGVIKVDDTVGFKVKAEVRISSDTQPTLTLEIKDVPDDVTIVVGPPSASMQTRTNLSLYTTGDNSKILQPRQKRPSIGPGEYDRAVYEEEPVVAIRVIQVDQYGNVVVPGNTDVYDGLIPKDFDDVILTRDTDKDVVNAKFYRESVLLVDLDLVRDTDKDVIRVRRLPI